MKSISNLQNVARWLSHTHTFVIVMLFTMMTNVLHAQAGELSFGSISVNPTTGYVAVPVEWTSINYSVPVFAARLELYISPGTVLCLDEAATKNSVASPFSASDVSISGGSIAIFKFNVTLPSDFTPLITLYFRDAPEALATIGIGGIHQVLETSSGPFKQIALPTPDTVQYETPPGFSISGLIRKAPMPDGSAPPECDGGSDIGIPNITVSFQAATTCFAGSTTNPFSEYSPDGYYATSGTPRYYVYAITPQKGDDTDCNCGLGFEDIDTARTFILGSKYPTLQQLIAADFNGNDTLTTYDLVLIAYCMLDTFDVDAYPNWLPWRFVPKTIYNANNPPPSPTHVPPLPHSITTSSLTGNLPNQDFYGIKRGDVVEQDCTECGGEEFAPPAEERETIALRDVFLETHAMTSGMEYMLPLRFSATTGMSVLGMELLFDAAQVEVLGIEKVGATESDYLTYTVKKQGSAAALRFVWFSMEPEGIDVAEAEAVFHLRVRAKQDASSLTGLVWQDAASRFNEAVCTGCPANRARLILNLHSPDTGQAFFAKLLGANPSRSVVPQLTLYLPGDAVVSSAVFDPNGRPVGQTEWFSAGGWNTVDLSYLPDVPGIYTIHITTVFGHETLRLVKL